MLFMALLVCACTACVKFPDPSLESRHPDKVLFDRAVSPEKCKQFDVAAMILQTLLNTYPDSDYSDRAKQALNEVMAARSDQSGSIDSQCKQENPTLTFGP
jgi:outer membrane protein assembly factor BamD (BamD/ComL family)